MLSRQYTVLPGQPPADAAGQGGEVEIHQGDIMWREAEDHSAANIGSVEMRATCPRRKPWPGRW
jgi:hypothetical protein